MSIVVTIDGPAASGKSSVSRELAKLNSWKWVSTGAFYRGLAFVASTLKTDLEDEEELLKLVASDQWHVKLEEEKTIVVFQGKDVSDKVFSERLGAVASKVSSYEKIRQALLQPQRDCAENVSGLVAEGRDCGSVVFPSADVKIYLTASERLRAQRRAEQSGEEIDKVQKKTEARDAADSSRKAAPLQVPEGAHIIETSELNFAEVVNAVQAIVIEKLKIKH